jgi:hypothetical protein
LEFVDWRQGVESPFYLFPDVLPEMQINGGSDKNAAPVLKLRMNKLNSVHAQRDYKGRGWNRYYPRPDNARCNAPLYAWR